MTESGGKESKAKPRRPGNGGAKTQQQVAIRPKGKTADKKKAATVVVDNPKTKQEDPIKPQEA